jgi:TM2 domain-containing membrane protein YozV
MSRQKKKTMKKISLIVLVLGVISISANMPNTEKAQSTTGVIADKLNHKDLVKIAEEVKGEKLSFKEKVGLRVFGKKIKTISKTGLTKPQGEKSQIVALIICWLIGVLGIHRFYLGYTWQGVVQLITLGGCGIWTLIDLIRIITGDLKPKDGNYDKTF